MNWRPKTCWKAENIARENLPMFKWGTQEYAHVIRGIDIGADAMLKALRDARFPYGENQFAGIEITKNGELLFILKS